MIINYDVWFLRYEAWQTEFFAILDCFLPVYPHNPKNQNFEKLKKKPLEISFYTSIPKIMIICYTVPEIWCVTDVLFLILGYFLPFYLPNRPKNQNFKEWKKALEISSFYNSVPKIMIICCTVPEIWHMMDVIIFHFGSLFALLPS